MGLLDGLEKFGFGGLDKVDIYEEAPKEKKEVKPEVKPEHVVEERDFLIDKEYECHVCNRKFKQRIVRPNRAKLAGQDRDLRPVYNGIDTLKYDVILCPYCGYSVLQTFYAALAKPHRQLIRENISANFKPMPDKVPEVIRYEEAATRYKLALFNAVVRQGKSSEKAMICLKTGWLMRGWADSLEGNTEEEQERISDCKKQERENLKSALEGFIKARATEQAPYAGMKESTLDYIIGALCVELNERLEDGARMLQTVAMSTSAGAIQKERAREMLEEIRNRLKAAQ
ncbi:MAG: DUF2225 domain-containing protein [Lachnospiraceae bacterium]|nr:DUF2225 domain-containing protein [Lachnospiraceae bacterium]